MRALVNVGDIFGKMTMNFTHDANTARCEILKKYQAFVEAAWHIVAP